MFYFFISLFKFFDVSTLYDYSMRELSQTLYQRAFFFKI